jgi:hypothetical protein
MSIISGSAAISTAAGSSDFYDFPIDQSLMFDGTGYLKRTVTNASPSYLGFTLSVWLKIFPDSTDQVILGQGSGVTDSLVLLQGENRIWYLNRAPAVSHKTTIEYRDPAAWYHLVVVVASQYGPSDITNRTKIYINNVLVPNNASYVAVDAATTINSNNSSYNELHIGRNPYGSSGFWKGYMANMELTHHSIESTDWDGSYFGETKNGIWVPKTFDGTSSTGKATKPPFYGVNGFRLDFAYDASATTTIKDVAPLSTQGTGSFSGQTDAHTAANDFTAYGF